MVEFEKFSLDNGLKVIVHKDDTTPIACINILYDVGARDEDPNRTGFAHLFEHLMFGGSVNIPNYDAPLQLVGGENNAFTSNDVTNYYLTLPVSNLETGFWLESDRMLSLAFSEKSLQVQRNVVIEEFKQRYLNQPYGDVWLLLKPLAYTTHPYLWSTIGKEIKQIEEATMEEVKAFFKKHYSPDNAIMVVAGNVETDYVRKLAEKWFGSIPKGNRSPRNLPSEPIQKEARKLKVVRDVPLDAIYKVWHMCERVNDNYYAADLMSDILSRGTSSRFYKKLVKEKKLFSDVNAYVSGDYDPGLFVVSGRLNEAVTMEQAEAAIEEELLLIKSELVSEEELEKVKNKVESTIEFSEMEVLNKAMELAFAELMGDASRVNSEVGRYRKVSREGIMEYANEIFKEENSSTLYYHKKS